MIRFELICDQEHLFESWFQSSTAFDKLANKNLLSCEICGSTSVRKSLMAPNLTAKASSATTDATSESTDLKIDDLKSVLEHNSEYVGDQFANEVRAIHNGDTMKRAVHGEASGLEVKSLINEGIAVVPLPKLTRKKTN